MAKSEIISSILQILPAVVMPLILWYLNHTESVTGQKQINNYIKRLELLEKLRDFNLKLPKEKSALNEELLQQEIREVQNFLRPQLDQEEEKKIISFDRFSKIRRFLLIFKPASFKVFILQFFFYIIFITIISFIPQLINSITAKTFSEDLGTLIIVIIFYIVLLIILSYYANKLQKRRLLKRTESTI